MAASQSSPIAPLTASLASGTQRLVALARRAPELVALMVMAVLGFAISVYLTSVHYAGVALVCNTGGIVNCAKVTSSAYSVIPGTSIPITIPGMLWFAVSGALAIVALVALERAQREPERLRLAHVIWGGLGVAFVFYLVFAELVKLRQICEWCTAVHVLTVLTFFVALYRLQQQMNGETELAPAAPPARDSSRAPGQGSRMGAGHGASRGIAPRSSGTAQGAQGTRGAARTGTTGAARRTPSARRKR